ncbi:flocculation protein FLO11 [Cephus cinctus]|uniref:Flocculation protein FLO11 n=1 Tax=Cephus cinctus TaxID=211228 RepID=A0AAJ7VZ34_CEPCN|nr:flocculation protein FLO11 [Cephus cinctus]XP_024938405.1 flocculation protein FLO11 [Cephus cinctus]XP_024938406.1 flocculation protein FLO11 [Cephus cinctus]
MSTIRESSHVSRKTVSHGGPISEHTKASSLENNLDALLEDLQTTVSRSATPSKGGRPLSPQVEYRVAANPTRVLSEGRSNSPVRTVNKTTEKFVTTGSSGAASGIPGLELLDAELQNVQPGQSKTVAYKQVSYQYNKSLDGKPIDERNVNQSILDSSSVPFVEEIHESSYEDNRPRRRHRSPDPSSKTSTVNRELLYSDGSTTSRSRQTSPLPGGQYRDVKYIHESSNYQGEPRPVQNTVTTVHSLDNSQEYGNREYIPVPSPTPAIPINLAPGPNTKVTTTIKTYTYELPGSPENYLPGSSLPRGVVLPGDQTITYTLPRGGSTDKTVTYHTQSVTNVSGQDGPGSPMRYASPPPTEVISKSSSLQKEAKFYREEHAYPPGSQQSQPGNTTIVYHTGSPPTNIDSTRSITRDEKYYQVNANYSNGHGPHAPGDRPDHPGDTTIIYQNQPPTINETHTTINRIEEHYPNRPSSSNRPPSSSRQNTPEGQKPGTPTRTTVNYYTAPPQTNPPQSSTTIYKYSNTTTTVPPNKYPEDHEVLLPKPFPTNGVQVYPSNAKPSPTNGQGPPAKLEDLMASFSDTEREVLADIAKQDQQQRKTRDTDNTSQKKQVEVIAHTPPKAESKNVAGPPVYYPPGSAEFTKKEESSAAMSQSSGGWQKNSSKYEYESGSKSKSKSSSGGAVVPVCLPLCCALPCAIL